jgi:cytidylate kinase
MIVAIDGPAATGKSTTAKLVAHKLGFTYLDTGAMYRCVTLSILKHDIHLDDKQSLHSLLSNVDIQFEKSGSLVFLNGEDVTDDIRKSAVTNNVSAVSSIQEVRAFLVKNQRKIAKNHDCVVEGRDIGTIVFSKAEVKIYLVADSRIRAKRRQLELSKLGEEKSLDILLAEIEKRDSLDSSRKNSPLRKANDAIEVDTSNMTINSQVEYIVNKVKLINTGN